jgi:hypothetical protein
MEHKELAEIRRRNLLDIRNNRFNESDAELARKLERPDAYVWQLLNGHKKGGRNIGERVARHIEKKLGLPRAAIDYKNLTPPALGQDRSEYQKYDADLRRVIDVWHLLTHKEREELRNEAVSKAEANRLVINELGRPANHPNDDKVASHYGLPPKRGQDGVKSTLKPK